MLTNSLRQATSTRSVSELISSAFICVYLRPMM
jgi:hypothetical protein